MLIHGGVWFSVWLGKAIDSRIDMVSIEESELVGRSQGTSDSLRRGRGHDGHGVLVGSRQFLQNVDAAFACLALLLHDSNDLFLLACTHELEDLIFELEAVLGGELGHHLFECQAKKVAEELSLNVSFVNVVKSEEFVDETISNLECQGFSVCQGVVTVEEELFDGREPWQCVDDEDFVSLAADLDVDIASSGVFICFDCRRLTSMALVAASTLVAVWAIAGLGSAVSITQMDNHKGQEHTFMVAAWSWTVGVCSSSGTRGWE
jgi:hypothetical protein